MAGKVKVKMKTDRGAAKRFKKTGSGKFKCRHQNLRHILTKRQASASVSCVAWFLLSSATYAQ